MKQYGTERVKRKFAFLPTKVSIDDYHYYDIWMSFYFIKQRWTNQGSSRIKSGGMFNNIYYDGWVTVGQGLDINVITWRKFIQL